MMKLPCLIFYSILGSSKTKKGKKEKKKIEIEIVRLPSFILLFWVLQHKNSANQLDLVKNL